MQNMRESRVKKFVGMAIDIVIRTLFGDVQGRRPDQAFSGWFNNRMTLVIMALENVRPLSFAELS